MRACKEYIYQQKYILTLTLEFLETFAFSSVSQPFLIGLESENSSLIGLETGWDTKCLHKFDSAVVTQKYINDDVTSYIKCIIGLCTTGEAMNVCTTCIVNAIIPQSKENMDDLAFKVGMNAGKLCQYG